MMCQWVFYGKDSQMCCYFFRPSKNSQSDVPFHPTRPFPVATLTSTQKKSVNDDGNLRSRNFLTQMNTVALLRASTKCDQISCFWSGSSRQHTQSQLNQRNSANCTNHPRKNGSLRIEASSTITSLISKQEKNIHPQSTGATSQFTLGVRCNFHQWANICYIYLWLVFNGDLPFGPAATCIIFCSSSKTRNSWSSGFLGPPRLSKMNRKRFKSPWALPGFWCERCCLGGVVCFFAVVVFKFGVNHLNKKTGGTVSYMACL